MEGSIRERARKVVAEVAGVSPEAVLDASEFANDLGMDSLDAVELSMQLEDAFHVEIDDDNLGKMKTFADALAFLEKAGAR